MGIINISREMPAPLDTVWSIISNLDQEPLYWHGMKSIRNLARIDANVIEREVIISYRNSRCRETVMLNPKRSIEVKITEGPMLGSKTIKLKSLEQDKTVIDVLWNIQLVGLLKVFSVIVKSTWLFKQKKHLKQLEKR